MKSTRNLLAGCAVVLASGLSAPAFADYTLSDDFHLVDNILEELALIHEANGTQPMTDPSAPVMTERRTRHVLQKAREVFERVQDLRHEKGLAEDHLPPFPVRLEISPDDVEALLEMILVDVHELRPVYGVTAPLHDTPEVTGKTATDVYVHLEDIVLSLDGLGLDEALTFHVYQVSVAMVTDLEKIREARGVSGHVELPGRNPGRSSGEIFEHVHGLLDDLQELTANHPDFAIPGGVVMPNMRQGEITIEHVMDLLDEAEAEIGAIKAVVGAHGATQFGVPDSASLPTNAYDAITLARLMVQSLAPDS